MSNIIRILCKQMRDKLTNKTMNKTEQEMQEITKSIQKGYEELMERNRQTIEWMKRVGLTK